jgi:hypothetical protein
VQIKCEKILLPSLLVGVFAKTFSFSKNSNTPATAIYQQLAFALWLSEQSL